MGSTSTGTQPNYDTTGGTMYGAVHQVGVSSFYMGETEVTQGLYEAVMSGYGSDEPSSNYSDGDFYPAYYVSWFDATIFCNKLSLLVGKTPCYSITGLYTAAQLAALAYNSSEIPNATGHANYVAWNANFTCDFSANGFRLPTEAEWEYAARGGQKNEYTRTLGGSGSTQYLYSGSNEIDDVAAYYNSTYINQTSGVLSQDGSGTILVKHLLPNELDLYDMSGNVMEWCWDRYGSSFYPATCCDEADPKGVVSNSNRVLRGGNWGNAATNCRVSYRSYNTPNNRNNARGFRVVLVP
jgi:formylglycine-generating enzyme required for sulfatase activity